MTEVRKTLWEFIFQHGVELKAKEGGPVLGKGLSRIQFLKWGIGKDLIRMAVKRGSIHETYIQTKQGLQKFYFIPCQEKVDGKSVNNIPVSPPTLFGEDHVLPSGSASSVTS